MGASIWYRILQFFASILRRFCVDFASIFDFCVDFASIFEPKSWSQTKKLELVIFASILRRFSSLKVGLRPKSWNSSSLN